MPNIWARANQPVHWFIGGNKEQVLWVGPPKSNICKYDNVEIKLRVVDGIICLNYIKLVGCKRLS
jgi:hypothetical protein